MALDYIDIDNTAPTTRLWQQYKKNEVIVSFFNYLKTYWQAHYYDFLDSDIIPNLSVYNANCDYLYFLALNLYNIKAPVKLLGQIFWDAGEDWDTGLSWDYIESAGPLTFGELKTVLLFILDWSRPNWDIPTLYYLVEKFTSLTWDDILVEQDDDNLDLFTITIPDGLTSKLLQLMINYYQDVLGLPFGTTFAIILT